MAGSTGLDWDIVGDFLSLRHTVALHQGTYPNHSAAASKNHISHTHYLLVCDLES